MWILYVWVSNTAGTTASEITTPSEAPPWDSPAKDVTVWGTSQYLDATASSGVTNVTYELSGGPSDLSDVQIATATPTISRLLVVSGILPAYPNGSYTLQSIASYAGGVSGTSARHHHQRE